MDDKKNLQPSLIEVSDSDKNESGFPNVPLIPNIHQEMLRVTSNPNALVMDTWHTCETTHCRAGWVVTLAGEAGKKLEEKTSPLFAAMQIYHKSCPSIPVSPVRFFDTNEEAMNHIKECARKEAELK